MEQRMSVVTLGVNDLARSKAFYQQALGWTISADEGQIAFFQLNGMVLALYPRDALADDAQVSGEGAGFAGVTLAYCTRSREETDEILRQVERAGARIVKPAREVFWGGYSGYFADPDGHLWEVAHNPFWTLDEKGNVHLEAP
jgi:uncharacterized protein